MRLFGKVGGAPDDIVLAVFYLTESGSIIDDNYYYIISYSNGNRSPNTLKTEISLDLAFDGTSVFCFDKIPAACVFYY